MTLLVGLSNSQHLWDRSLRCEPESHSRVARQAARLDAMVWKVRAKLLVTRGLFQRTWSGQDRPPAITGVRDLRRDRSLPRICDASRARPSAGEDVRSYSRA